MKIIVISLLLVISITTTAEPYPEQLSGKELEINEIEEEIEEAPSIDYRDEQWVPYYKWHSGETGQGKGIESVRCINDKMECVQYKENVTGEKR